MNYQDEEIWADIEGYEGFYQVSNHGRVRSMKRGARKYLKNKNPSGRDVRVSLWKEKRPKDFLVHRLVVMAFLPKVEGKNYVNHKDGNPKNNHISNLEWCNHSENNNHAFDNRLIKTARRVVLVNQQTLDTYYFRSASKASHFLGKRDTFVSNLIERGVGEYEGYDIYVRLDQIS